ncbi:TonB-dependent receptor plug domain-containing protein [Aliikangiella sp. IMCC44359]|uniref:TonB-dependent receptor plug domain-containing protein n=1 Tax=Aliikangiella sp. IMCC44359 TaxID=3459125 RepID=UPI00403AA75E
MLNFNKMFKWLVSLTLFLNIVLSTIVIADANHELELKKNNEVYSVEFFTSYAPQTALDMVLRLPGFTLQEEEDVRGFGATAGNVLIDGIRPPSKSGGIKNALLRIPASQVKQIEILRGINNAGDAAGQSVVANIVKANKLSAKRWQLILENTAGNGGKLYPQSELNFSTMLDEWKSSFKLNASKEKYPRDASIVSVDAQGELLTTQKEEQPSELNEVFLSSDLSKTIKNDTWQITSQIGWSQYRPDTKRWIYNQRPVSQMADSFYHNEKNSQYYSGEVGVDWAREYKQWTWRLLGLANWQNWWVDALSREELPVEFFLKGTKLRFDEHKKESVIRTTLSKKAEAGFSHEYGLEIAYNQMNSSLQLDSINTNNDVIGKIKANNAFVEEYRSEAFVNATWALNAYLIKLGLAGEYSQISVTGDSDNEQSLVYWKPSLAINYNLSEWTQYRLMFGALVGQLDFSDFAASADLVNDRLFFGNPKLNPEQTTRMSFSFDHRFKERGAVNLEVYHEWRKDVLEQLALTTGEQFLGNAGKARLWGVNTVFNLPLDGLINGGLVEITADWLDSEFDDPVISDSRMLTELENPQVKIDFRQDFSQFRWGVGYSGYQKSETYYVDEYDVIKDKPRWNAFIETSVFEQLKVRLEVENWGKERQYRERLLYTDNRGGELARFEKTDRVRGERIKLTIGGEF